MERTLLTATLALFLAATLTGCITLSDETKAAADRLIGQVISDAISKPKPVPGTPSK